MDALILGEIPDQAQAAAAIVAPVLVSPVCAKILCVAIVILVMLALGDLVAPTKGTR